MEFDYKKLRKIKRYNQTEMADYLGLSLSAYQHLEYGKTTPRATLSKLSRLYFWRELNIPHKLIMQDLGLDEANKIVHELEPGYEPQTEAERYYYNKLKEVEQREQLYVDVIKTLQDQLNKKD